MSKFAPHLNHDFQNDWKNGWNKLFQKEITKMSFQKAFYFSAKDFIKLYRSQASQSIINLIEHDIELGKCKQFVTLVGESIGVDEKNGELSEQILEKLNSVQTEVSNILEIKPTHESAQDSEIKTKEAFIRFWFETLESDVINFVGENSIQKSILLACRNHPETQKIGEGIYTGISSHMTKFSHILKVLLESNSNKIEDLLNIIYTGRSIPKELPQKNSTKKFRNYPKKGSI